MEDVRNKRYIRLNQSENSFECFSIIYDDDLETDIIIDDDIVTQFRSYVE